MINGFPYLLNILPIRIERIIGPDSKQVKVEWPAANVYRDYQAALIIITLNGREAVTIKRKNTQTFVPVPSHPKPISNLNILSIKIELVNMFAFGNDEDVRLIFKNQSGFPSEGHITVPGDDSHEKFIL